MKPPQVQVTVDRDSTHLPSPNHHLHQLVRAVVPLVPNHIPDDASGVVRARKLARFNLICTQHSEHTPWRGFFIMDFAANQRGWFVPK